MKRMRNWLLLAAVVLLLAGCGGKDAPETTGSLLTAQQRTAESLTLVADPALLAELEECEYLKTLDLTGSTCYPEILAFVRNNPQVKVLYTVPIGAGAEISSLDTEQTLEEGTYEIDALRESLAYLPNLKKLHFPRTELNAMWFQILEDEFPGLKCSYTVDILGSETGMDTRKLDLSAAGAEDVSDLCRRLTLLPELEEVTLMDSAGKAALAPEDAAKLVGFLPQVRFDYRFRFFDQEVSTETEKLEIHKLRFTAADEEELRAGLTLMPKLRSFRITNTGQDNDLLYALREEFPQAGIVWQIQFGNYAFMTDVESFRTVYNFGNSDARLLKYFRDIKYIDMGHNPELSDLTFVKYLPKLEILIASGSTVRDLKDFENCRSLVFLELANCMELRDISALRGCTSLRFLNLSYARVEDLSPLDDLKLERFVYLHSPLSQEARDAFEAGHPECWTRFTGDDPYNIAWRYDDYGMTFSEYYLFVREVFQYDEVDERIRREQEAEADRLEQEANQSTQPPATEPPATQPPATQPPTTEPPAAPPPETQPPAPPATEAPPPAPEPPPADSPEE